MGVIEPTAINTNLSVSNGIDSIEVEAAHERSGLVSGYLENITGLAEGIIDKVLTEKLNPHLPTPSKRFLPPTAPPVVSAKAAVIAVLVAPPPVKVPEMAPATLCVWLSLTM
jgi:hypothetical protein